MHFYVKHLVESSRWWVIRVYTTNVTCLLDWVKYSKCFRQMVLLLCCRYVNNQLCCQKPMIHLFVLKYCVSAPHSPLKNADLTFPVFRDSGRQIAVSQGLLLSETHPCFCPRWKWRERASDCFLQKKCRLCSVFCYASWWKVGPSPAVLPHRRHVTPRVMTEAWSG